ncbi:UDP-N-acetylmuramoyl-L-alanine--D-glutamate ligase [Candidatus Aerophobetes bacterium]|uniref:UDP-N-acetylmuramoylalanine--D-glutamate ligase n=1 Tax=Aerophobetes bacterium TaxID=2030807 RepID=A0A2A4X2E6_UNCAE|nr:MAG: UDP-N-acetylmuramoyl-L-alanine--D-glutamate ligase [Candidatus Aerophobetes bacterium]
MKKVLVVGMGESGKGAALWLRSLGRQVLVCDSNPDKIKGDWNLLSDPTSLTSKAFDQVVISPGIEPSSNALIKKAYKEGIEVIGELELALRSIRGPVIAITGTNGKTTLALFLAHLFKQEGVDHTLMGNIGNSACYSLLKSNNPNTLNIIEMSSFQLETVKTRSIDLGIITSFAPDHLDRHGSFESYARAKGNLLKAIKEEGLLFISSSVKKRMLESDAGLKSAFERVVTADLEKAKPYANMALPSSFFSLSHAIAMHLNIRDQAWENGVHTFEKPRHRLEFVLEHRGIEFYNDSKATNEEALFFALSYFTKPLVLLLGGASKGLDLEKIRERVAKSGSRVIVYGEAGQELYTALKETNSVFLTHLFKDAVEKSLEIGKKGDIVLLSPACTSWDQFSRFEQRGDCFKKIIEESRRS